MYFFIVFPFVISLAAMFSVISGFGFSTISLIFLTIFVPFKQALALVGFLHIFISLFKIFAFKGAFKPLSYYFLVGGVVMSFIGALIAGLLPVIYLQKTLACFLIAQFVLFMYKPQIRVRYTQGTALFSGALSGFLAGLIGMGGAVRSYFLSLFDLPKEVYIATGGLIALVIDVTRVGVYVYASFLDLKEMFVLIAFALPFLALGLFFGKKIVVTLPQSSFRMFVATALVAYGFYVLLFK